MKHSIFFLALIVPLSLRAQQKTYLESLPYYVENLQMFGEGQEDGRTYYIPSTSITLDGTWKFLYCGNPSLVPDDFFEPSFSDIKWSNIMVPSNWEMQGFGQALFRNTVTSFSRNGINPPQVPMDLNPTGLYRTDFKIPSSWNGRQVFLRFEKVASASFVWINGHQVGYNEGAQEPSEYNITKFIKSGRNSLAVMVLKYSDGCYLECQDYWRLAGIFDDVTVYSSPNTRIWDYHVITDFDTTFTDSKVDLDVEIRAYTFGNHNCTVKAEIEKDGHTISKMTANDISIPAESGKTVRLSSYVKNPDRWTSETPNLYNLSIELTDSNGKTIDHLKRRMGFKKTEIIDGIFYLNGQPIKVNAQNSHMQHPVTGHAMDEETIRKDMQILKQFGFNAVRTSHYPPVNKYLELADEYGLYIIDETGDESHATEWMSEKPEYADMYRERARQMVLRDRNHPCVLFWSAGNESGEGKNIEEVIKEGRKYDSTRFWMYGGNASKHYAEDIIGPRYPIPIEHEISYGMNAKDKRPSFMDEYLSVAGNGGGGLDDFWRVIDSHPSLLGGAIWDFVSPGLLEPVRTLEDKSPYGTMVNIMGKAKLVKGKTGNAIDLDVTDQWVQAYRGDNLEISTDRLTLTLDILPRGYNKCGGYMITKGSNQFGLRQSGADKIEFYIDNGKRIALSGPLPDDWEGKWHNVCAVYDSRMMTIYIDSRIVAEKSASGKIRNLPMSVCIGRDEEKHGQETSEYIADALIDNVGIFTDAFTPAEGFDPQKSVLWLDFEKEKSEGTFYSYGIGARTYGSIWPDRTPQPEMYQMKKSTQPLSYKLLDARTGVLEIRNRSSFINASYYRTSWTITADDKVVDSGEVKLDIEPSSSKIVRIPYCKPDIEPGKEYRLTISTALADDEIWAAKGHEVAWEQFELSHLNIPANLEEKASGTLSVVQENGHVIVAGDFFRYVFDEVNGTLNEIHVNGKNLLKSPLKLNLWRAPVANESDGWNSNSVGMARDRLKGGYGVIGSTCAISSMYYSEGLDRLMYIPASIKVRSYEEYVYVDVRELALFGAQAEQKLDQYITGQAIRGMESFYSYCIAPDGTITINHKITPQGNMPLWFPRIGVTMSLDGTLDNVQWYGRGPQSSYPDRKSGYRIGIYESSIDEMYEPYLLPQDYGLRMDSRWVRLTDNQGLGILFKVDRTFAFNAYPYTTENLTRSVYQYQLQRSDDITLNIDYQTSGVGCTARGIFESYRAHATDLDRTITIKPVK